jgi:sugar phosphate isomerase/epimerase
MHASAFLSKNLIDKSIMKKSVHTFLCIVITFGLISCSSPQKGSSTAKKTLSDLGWNIGTQAWTFRNYTFLQAVDKTKKLGLHYIEAYPGQKIGGNIGGKMGYNLNDTARQKILNYLKKKNVKLIAFGVTTPKTHVQWDSLFAFANEMDIKNITSQPPPDQLSYVSKLCNKYNINVAIHNHPKPSIYWSPDTLLAALKSLKKPNPHIGACADVGHWVRSGLDPIKSIKKLSGHIIELHMKDVNARNAQAQDTVWGTGVIDMKGIVRTLKRQNFEGLFSIEYESHPKDNMNQIKKSLNYFDSIITEGK